MVLIADGTERAERKLARTFWSDPALGIARYVDAGYEAATDQARANAVKIPALERDE
jgi:urocanate hydratase